MTEREQIIAIIEAEIATWAPKSIGRIRMQSVIRRIQAAPAYKPEAHGCPHPRCYARLHDLTVSTDHAKGPETGK